MGKLSPEDERFERLKRALREAAAEEIPQLIAQARDDARARAREALAEAMTEALLEQAEAELGTSRRPARKPPASRAREPAPAAPPEPVPAAPPPSSPAPPQLHAEPAQDTDTALYLYCVVRAGAEVPPDLTGIEPRHALRLMEHEDLAALVSPVPLADFEEERLREHLSDMHWLERTARTHEDVLESVGESTTLIPMRLCTILRSEDSVRDMLTRERHALVQALDHLVAKSEWGVKVFAPDGGAPDIAGTARPQDGTEYLQRRQQERERRDTWHEHLHESCARIHERLAAVAADALTTTPQRREVSGRDADMLMSGVYLVEDERLPAFLELVDRLREEHASEGLELESTGPWPAYNFVPGTIGAAW